MLVGHDEMRQREADGVKEQKMPNGIEAQAVVVTAGPQVWKQVGEWAIEHTCCAQRNWTSSPWPPRPGRSRLTSSRS